MPRRAAGLTAAKVRTAKPGRHGDGGGLYLLVRSAEARFWVFRYTPRGGKMREIGLGRAGGPGAVALAEARERAADLQRQVKAGVDPLAKREADAASAAAEAVAAEIREKTFRDVAGLFLASHEAAWRNPKHRQQWRNTLDAYAHPHMGDTPVAEVATEHVTAALEPIWREKPETASRVRGRIEAVLDYAAARGWREGENPARWRGHLARVLPARAKLAKVEHHPALPWREAGAFMAALRAREGMAARALELVILTAARTGEALGMRWGEVDLGDGLWTVPAERMKAGREHRVPLPAAATALLRGLNTPAGPFPTAGRERESIGTIGTIGGIGVGPSADALVFPGVSPGRPLSNMALLMLLRRMGRGDLTAHGFRSTFRDWAAEATAFPRELAEAALAHTLRDKVEAAYRRGDMLEKRRRLMEAWAAFCERPAPAQGETVRPIAGARAPRTA